MAILVVGKQLFFFLIEFQFITSKRWTRSMMTFSFTHCFRKCFFLSFLRSKTTTTKHSYSYTSGKIFLRIILLKKDIGLQVHPAVGIVMFLKVLEQDIGQFVCQAHRIL